MPAERSDLGYAADAAPGTVIVHETRRGLFQQEIIAGGHRLIADEPTDVGGLDSGPVRMICCLPRSAPARR